MPTKGEAVTPKLEDMVAFSFASDLNRSTKWLERGVKTMTNRVHRDGTIVLSVVIALAFCVKVSPLIGDDFWKEKKSSEWSESEARLIVNDSPWAKQAKLQSNIGIPKGNPSGSEINRGPRDDLPAGAGGPGVPVPSPGSLGERGVFVPSLGVPIALPEHTVPVTREPPKDPVNPEPIKIKILPPSGGVIVLWESALPVQEGKAKLQMSDAATNGAVDFFIVSVIGWPLSWDQTAPANTKEWIRQSAALLRKGKDPVRASKVELTRSEGAMTLRFFFSRAKLIQASDKQVIFRLELGPMLVEARFSPKEMVYGGVLAL